jgi:hypothetical protein
MINHMFRTFGSQPLRFPTLFWWSTSTLSYTFGDQPLHFPTLFWWSTSTLSYTLEDQPQNMPMFRTFDNQLPEIANVPHFCQINYLKWK